MDVDPLHRHGNGVQQRLQPGQILLVDAEFAGASCPAAHAEAGIHAHTDGTALPLPLTQRADPGHLSQRVGDDLTVVPRGLQRLLRLSGGGEEDIPGSHAAFPAQQHLPGRGGVRADTEGGQRPHHRREGIGLDGVQQIVLREGTAQRFCLLPQHVVFVEVTGRVFPRQRQDVVVHDDAPLLFLRRIRRIPPAIPKGWLLRKGNSGARRRETSILADASGTGRSRPGKPADSRSPPTRPPAYPAGRRRSAPRRKRSRSARRRRSPHPGSFSAPAWR